MEVNYLKLEVRLNNIYCKIQYKTKITLCGNMHSY